MPDVAAAGAVSVPVFAAVTSMLGGGLGALFAWLFVLNGSVVRRTETERLREAKASVHWVGRLENELEATDARLRCLDRDLQRVSARLGAIDERLRDIRAALADHTRVVAELSTTVARLTATLPVPARANAGTAES